MSNFTILIQGPINQVSLDGIEDYKKYGEVIISTYANDQNLHLLDGIKCKKVFGHLPMLNVFDGTNIFKQLFSTLNGLQSCETKFVIKTRSDERYANIQPFIETIEKNPDLYTSCNIFFKGPSEPMHPSNHMIGGRTDVFLKAFSILRDICISIPNNAHHLNAKVFSVPHLGSISTETSFFLAFLIAKGINMNEINENNHNEYTLSNTRLVNIDDMKPYIWSYSLNGKRYYESTSDSMYQKYPSLRSLDEFYNIKYVL